MGKQILYNPVTGETTVTEVPDEPIEEVIVEPSIEERLKATEDALLKLLGGGS